MKTKRKMLAMVAGAALLACSVARGAPWNEEAVAITDGDVVLTPTTYENVSLLFDGEAAKDGDVVAVFRDGDVLCGYGEVFRSSLEIIVYASKDEPLSLKVWRNGTDDAAVLDVSKVTVGGTETTQLLAPNPGELVAGLALVYETPPEMHTLTFNTAGGSAVAPVTLAVGTAVTAPVSTRTGYTFAGWNPAAPATMPAEDMTLTAQWTVNQYTVTFDAAGGTGGKSAKQDYGSAIVAPADPTREGYTFTSWSPAVAATVPANDVTYTAQWKANQYTVTFNANGGTGGKTVTQDYGTALSAPAVSRTGYTFTSWSPAVPATVPADNVTYTAQWKVNQYTVTFNANGGTGSKSAKQDYGSAIVAPAVARENYTFVGWSPAVAATVPANDVTYTAQWKPVQKRITINLGVGTDGVVVPLDYGTLVGNIPAPTRSGYNFDGWWTAAEGGVRIPDGTVITGDMTLYAHWTLARPQLWDDVAGAAPAVVSTYDGYLYDANGNVKGTFLVKVGKPNKRTGFATVKGTMIGLDGKKVQLAAADKGKALIAADGSTTVSLTGGDACEVTLGAKGMSGTYGNATIDGSLNVFASKDAADKAVATAALDKWQGPVNVAWQGAQGWNGLSVTIAAKGKAKVAGTLADGTKVSAKGQLLVGDEWYCVPVVVSKKVQLAFNVWLPKTATGTALPKVVGLNDAIVGKPGTLKAGAKFNLGTVVGDAKYAGYLPDGLAVGGGAKWTLPKTGKVAFRRGSTEVDESKLGENPSALKLTYKAKDGSFKGSFKAYADANGKLKATTVNVTGVLVNGVGYGTATVKGGASVPVTVE